MNKTKRSYKKMYEILFVMNLQCYCLMIFSVVSFIERNLRTPVRKDFSNTGDGDGPKSTLIVSEFIGCSPSLSGAIRVNPWNIDSLADALNMAMTIPDAEKRMRHEKHYRYVSTHDVAYWAQSFMGDLERTCKDHLKRRSWGIGFGLSFRIMALDPNFRKLSPEHIASAYRRTSSRAILLDYDGTMMSQTSINKTPSPQVLQTLNILCSDPRNYVFIVSGRGRSILGDWFASCGCLGIAAEHGYFYRYFKPKP